MDSRCADLVGPLGVLVDDRALAWSILQIVDELVAPAPDPGVFGDRGQTRDHDRRYASARRVVDAAPKVLSPHVDVDQHQLRLPRDHRVTVSRAERRHFMRAHDDFGHAGPVRFQVCEGFDERGMVAAQIREDVIGAEFSRESQQALGAGGSFRHRSMNSRKDTAPRRSAS